MSKNTTSLELLDGKTISTLDEAEDILSDCFTALRKEAHRRSAGVMTFDSLRNKAIARLNGMVVSDSQMFGDTGVPEPWLEGESSLSKIEDIHNSIVVSVDFFKENGESYEIVEEEST